MVTLQPEMLCNQALHLYSPSRNRAVHQKWQPFTTGWQQRLQPMAARRPYPLARRPPSSRRKVQLPSILPRWVQTRRAAILPPLRIQ